MMHICGECGADQPAGHKYCVACGSVMGAARSSPKAMLYAVKARRWVEEAERCHQEGKLREAASACEEALAVDRHNTTAHALLGVLYDHQGHREQAVREYRSALAGEAPAPDPTPPAASEIAPLPQGRCRAIICGAFALAVVALIGALYLISSHWPALQAR
jgi:tetratricopeptide (TPR) repeat protein